VSIALVARQVTRVVVMGLCWALLLPLATVHASRALWHPWAGLLQPLSPYWPGHEWRLERGWLGTLPPPSFAGARGAKAAKGAKGAEIANGEAALDMATAASTAASAVAAEDDESGALGAAGGGIDEAAAAAAGPAAVSGATTTAGGSGGGIVSGESGASSSRGLSSSSSGSSSATASTTTKSSPSGSGGGGGGGGGDLEWEDGSLRGVLTAGWPSGELVAAQAYVLNTATCKTYQRPRLLVQTRPPWYLFASLASTFPVKLLARVACVRYHTFRVFVDPSGVVAEMRAKLEAEAWLEAREDAGRARDSDYADHNEHVFDGESNGDSNGDSDGGCSGGCGGVNVASEEGAGRGSVSSAESGGMRLGDATLEDGEVRGNGTGTEDEGYGAFSNRRAAAMLSQGGGGDGGQQEQMRKHRPAKPSSRSGHRPPSRPSPGRDDGGIGEALLGWPAGTGYHRSWDGAPGSFSVGLGGGVDGGGGEGKEDAGVDEAAVRLDAWWRGLDPSERRLLVSLDPQAPNVPALHARAWWSVAGDGGSFAGNSGGSYGSGGGGALGKSGHLDGGGGRRKRLREALGGSGSGFLGFGGVSGLGFGGGSGGGSGGSGRLTGAAAALAVVRVMEVLADCLSGTALCVVVLLGSLLVRRGGTRAHSVPSLTLGSSASCEAHASHSPRRMSSVLRYPNPPACVPRCSARATCWWTTTVTSWPWPTESWTRSTATTATSPARRPTRCAARSARYFFFVLLLRCLDEHPRVTCMWCRYFVVRPFFRCSRAVMCSRRPFAMPSQRPCCAPRTRPRPPRLEEEAAKEVARPQLSPPTRQLSPPRAPLPPPPLLLLLLLLFLFLLLFLLL